MNSNANPTDNKGYQDLSDRLNALEIRLTRLESERKLTPVSADDNEIEK